MAGTQGKKVQETQQRKVQEAQQRKVQEEPSWSEDGQSTDEENWRLACDSCKDAGRSDECCWAHTNETNVSCDLCTASGTKCLLFGRGISNLDVALNLSVASVMEGQAYDPNELDYNAEQEWQSRMLSALLDSNDDLKKLEEDTKEWALSVAAWRQAWDEKWSSRELYKKHTAILRDRTTAQEPERKSVSQKAQKSARRSVRINHSRVQNDRPAKRESQRLGSS